MQAWTCFARNQEEAARLESEQFARLRDSYGNRSHEWGQRFVLVRHEISEVTLERGRCLIAEGRYRDEALANDRHLRLEFGDMSTEVSQAQLQLMNLVRELREEANEVASLLLLFEKIIRTLKI